LKDNKFQRWKIGETLNLGFNPHPLWLYLNVKNRSDAPEKYWWDLYSHADSVFVYQKENNIWVIKDTLSYGKPIGKRDIKVRFLVSEFLFQPGENKELL